MSDFISPDGPVIARGLLDKADLQSQAWHKLSTHLEAQLMTLRKRNDNPDLDPLATAALRGGPTAIAARATVAVTSPPRAIGSTWRRHRRPVRMVSDRAS